MENLTIFCIASLGKTSIGELHPSYICGLFDKCLVWPALSKLYMTITKDIVIAL
jgi:hypothetical protein